LFDKSIVLQIEVVEIDFNDCMQHCSLCAATAIGLNERLITAVSCTSAKLQPAAAAVADDDDDNMIISSCRPDKK